MTVQAINGANREDLLRLTDTALRIWPKCGAIDSRLGPTLGEHRRWSQNGHNNLAILTS